MGLIEVDGVLVEEDREHKIIKDINLAARVIKYVESELPLAIVLQRELGEKEFEEYLASLPPEEQQNLEHNWRMWGRPNQLEPRDEWWLTWMILAGRGWGKTRAGAEWVHEKVNTGVYGRFHLVGATVADARDIIVEGPSGILATQKPWNPCVYQPTKRKVLWDNGAEALVFSAEEPERLRGVQCEAAWCDELASWRQDQDTWSQLQLGLRLGKKPRTIITTTPRPTKLIRDIAGGQSTYVTKGITYENLDNLAPAFIQEIYRVFEGTRFGQQEIYADILDDSPGALFNRENLDQFRVKSAPEDFDRVVVAVDPAMSVTEESAETGIVVAGRKNREAYVLRDVSGKLKPDQWTRRVCDLYHEHMAAAVVIEVNQGGELLKHTINAQDPSVKVRMVRATKGKELRAEPVSTLYEKGLVHHVGNLADLENQMCTWEPGMDSPDRLDALVWAITDLLVGGGGPHVLHIGPNELGGKSYWKSMGKTVEKQPAWLSPKESGDPKAP